MVNISYLIVDIRYVREVNVKNYDPREYVHYRFQFLDYLFCVTLKKTMMQIHQIT